MNSRRLGSAILGVLITLAVVLGSPSTASAMNMKAARGAVAGGCIYKHDDHILSCVKGTYKFHRMIRKHKRTVFGVILSAQHCKLGRHKHCWGPVKGGPIRAANAPGKAVKGEPAKPKNYCFPTICTNPFYWLTGTAKAIEEMQHRIVDPCENGGLKGFGGALLANNVAKAMLSSGAISEATMLAKFSNPESIAFLSVAGCVGKVVQQGEGTFDHFLFRLQHPFGFKHAQEVRHGR